MNFEPIPDPFPPVVARPPPAPLPLVPPPLVPPPPLLVETREKLGAEEAETTLTGALAALKRRGKHTLATVESTLGPTRLVVGATLAIGLGALFFFALSRRRAAPRRPSAARTMARAVARDIVVRVALGAAAAAGARLAETVLVPMLVASISARNVRPPPHARRARKTPALSPTR